MQKNHWLRRPEAIWWLVCGTLAIAIVLVLARQLMG